MQSAIEGFAIIGIECFAISMDGNITPNMDEIADFSHIIGPTWSAYQQRCDHASRLFIDEILHSRKSDGYYFVLVAYSAQ